ncbi:MAG: type II/IV secretion system ATPase subunit [Candidatus Woesearchaeota archaeon]
MGLFSKKLEISQEKKSIFKFEQPIIPNIPDIIDKTKLDVKYPLISPYVYAHVFWDSTNNELVYNIEEPVLDEKEKKLLSVLEDGIRELINISFISVKDPNIIIEYLEKNIRVLLNELQIKISDDTLIKIMYYIYRDFVGLNEIEPLLRDYFIEDIECNGANTPIYIVHRRYKNLRTNIIYNDIKELTNFVEKLAQKSGQYISYANPLLDAALPDGSRVNATYTQDISSRGPTFTIRKFTKEPWSPIKLMEFRTVSPELLAYIWLLIEHECNIMVIGGTGSGKTTLLNTFAFFIPPSSRVVSIEDTRELNILHENWLPSVTRSGIGMGAEGKRGEIDLFTLLKESFRQRPDYVIVGEVRGVEAFVLFQGMASGHPSLGTMHAEDVPTMVRRLETPPINLSPALVDSLDVVCVMITAKLGDKMVRRVKEIVEILKVEENIGEAIENKPFIWDPKKDKFFFKPDSRVFDKIVLQHGIMKQDLYREFKIRSELLMRMYRRGIFGYKEVHDIINEYYKMPHTVLKRFGIIQ